MCFLLAFKGDLQRCPFALPSFGSGFKVQGRGGGFAAFFLLGQCPEVAFKPPVTSHSYDTREGIVSHVWHEILRLSPHLFWLGLFTHRAFLSVQDDDTGERVVSRGGGFAAFFYWTMPESGIQVTGYQS